MIGSALVQSCVQLKIVDIKYWKLALACLDNTSLYYISCSAGNIFIYVFKKIKSLVLILFDHIPSPLLFALLLVIINSIPKEKHDEASERYNFFFPVGILKIQILLSGGQISAEIFFKNNQCINERNLPLFNKTSYYVYIENLMKNDPLIFKPLILQTDLRYWQ